MATRRPLGLIALLLALAGCGGSGSKSTAPSHAPIVHRDAHSATQVVVGATGRPEQRLLSQIDADGLRAAGFRARVQGGFSGAADALDAISTGSIDVYPDYAANVLAALGAPTISPMPAEDAMGRVRARLSQKDAEGFPGASFGRALGVVVAARTARRLKLTRIADLGKSAPHLRIAGPRGCQRRPDCLPALRRVYALHFRRFVGVRPDLVHEPIRTGAAAATIVSTTDPHIGRDGEVLLRDDRRAFPGSPVVVAVRREAARRGGSALPSVLERAGSALTPSLMQELLARMEFDERPSAAVARQYLRASGLVRTAG
jgi:osmoprotectant transport system substrate-binding protein